MLGGVAIALAALVAFVYRPVGQFGFLNWEDQWYVTHNRHVLAGLTWNSVAWAFTSAARPYWHPLTWLSHETDVTLFGLNAGGHHLMSVAIHALASALLFLLVRRMTGALWRSAFVAAVFAVHPLHVESVAWIAERKDVLSALFWILTLWSYVSYVRQPSRARFALVILMFLLALLAKPMVVTLPAVMLLLDVWPLRRVSFTSREGWREVVVEKWPLFALAIAGGLVTVVVQSHIGALQSFGVTGWSDRVANAVVAYVAYLGKAIVPVGLSAFYARNWALPAWEAAGAAAVIAGISAFAIFRARRQPYVLVGWLWFLGTLLPVVGLIQSGEQAMADRFMYVPLVGLSMIAAWGVPDLIGRRATILLRAGAGVIVVSLAVIARTQVTYWSDDVTLWTHAVDVTHENYFAYNLLGLAYKDRGQWDEAIANHTLAATFAPQAEPDFRALVDYNIGYAKAQQGRADEALQFYTTALALKPNFPEAHNDIAALLARQNKPAEALPHYFAALKLQPDFAEAQNGLGAALAMQGHEDDAIAHYLEALRIDPTIALAHVNLAMVWIHQGKNADAIRELLAATAIEPNHAIWQYNLGVLLARQGQRDDARARFTMALRIDPTLTAARQALDSLDK